MRAEIAEHQDIEDDSESARACAELNEVVSYWRTLKRSPAGVPLRSDIDPARLIERMPDLFLVEKLPDPGTYKVRLAGDEVRSIYGVPLQDKTFEEIHLGPIYEHLVSLYDRARETREPIYFSGTLYWLDRSYVGFLVALSPLSSTGRDVDMVLAMIRFQTPSDRPAGDGST